MTAFEEGMRLFKMKDWDGAADQFEKATQEDDQNHKAWNALGVIYGKLAVYEQADQCFTNALILDPDNTIYQKNKATNERNLPIKRSSDFLELEDEPKSPPVKTAPKPVQQYTLKQYGMALVSVAGIFFILMLVAAAVGGGGSGSVSSDDSKFISIMKQSGEDISRSQGILSKAGDTNDFSVIKSESQKESDNINMTFSKISSLQISSKYQTLNEKYSKALNSLRESDGYAIMWADKQLKDGKGGVTEMYASINQLNDYTNQMNEINKYMKQIT